MREVLNKWFWVNYVITLLATCWIPLLSVTPTFTLMQPGPDALDNTGELPVSSETPKDGTPVAAPDEAGTPQTVKGPTTNVPLYSCYYRLAQGKFKSYTLPVVLHLTLCFLVSFWTWRIVLKTGRKAA